MGGGATAPGLHLAGVPPYVFWLIALVTFGTFIWCGLRTWQGRARVYFLTGCATTWLVGAAHDKTWGVSFGIADWGAVGLLLLGFVIVSGGRLDRIASREDDRTFGPRWKRQLAGVLVGVALLIPYWWAFSDYMT